MFVDKVKIMVRAGDGGHGAVAFHREKYVANGGPDGGDGGKGGNIVLRVDDNLSTLMDFRYKRKYTAPNGQDGQGARCKGKRGEDSDYQGPQRYRRPRCSDWRSHQGHVEYGGFHSLQGWPRRLGQPAFCHTHPAGAQICQNPDCPARSMRWFWS